MKTTLPVDRILLYITVPYKSYELLHVLYVCITWPEEIYFLAEELLFLKKIIICVTGSLFYESVPGVVTAAESNRALEAVSSSDCRTAKEG